MTTTQQAPTAIEMSKTIVDQISQAVASGGDATAARAALADVLKNQGGAVAAAAAPSAPDPGKLVIDREFVTRPNGEKYILRKVGGHTDIAMLRKARERLRPVLLYGPPGTGKTAGIEAAFDGDDLPEGERGMYTVPGTGDTSVPDFVGGFIQLPGGKYEWVDGPMLRAMEEGKVLFIDEVLLVDPKVLAVAYSGIDGRGEYRVTDNPERGVVKAAPGFFICGAGNPNAPGASMSEALVSRFQIQAYVGTDYKMAKQLGASAKAVTSAQNMAKKQTEGAMGWAPQLRELLAFRDNEADFGTDFALRNMVAAAPEIDRGQVQDVLSRTFGIQKGVTGLKFD